MPECTYCSKLAAKLYPGTWPMSGRPYPADRVDSDGAVIVEYGEFCSLDCYDAWCYEREESYA